MKRLIIAMMVVAGMSLVTSSAMAQGRHHGHHGHHGHHAHHRHHGHHHHGYHHQRHYRHYYPAPVRYYAPAYPRYYAPPVYYRPASSIGIHTRGFSFGIGF